MLKVTQLISGKGGVTLSGSGPSGINHHIIVPAGGCNSYLAELLKGAEELTREYLYLCRYLINISIVMLYLLRA